MTQIPTYILLLQYYARSPEPDFITIRPELTLVAELSSFVIGMHFFSRVSCVSWRSKMAKKRPRFLVWTSFSGTLLGIFRDIFRNIVSWKRRYKTLW